MTGNVQLATEGQFDECRICLERSFNKLRGRLDFTTAEEWIGNSQSLDRFVEGLLPPSTAITSASTILTVHYGPAEKPRTLEEMIVAGHYDWLNNDITAESFPFSGAGVVSYESKLFHFGTDTDIISFDKARRRIRKDDPANPWEPAKIEHTLSYGATFPEDQRQFPIVGLGSVALIRGDRCMVCLRRCGSWRYLGLLARARGGYGRYRFLAVRKIQNSGS